jgi:hypothetical protein
MRGRVTTSCYLPNEEKYRFVLKLLERLGTCCYVDAPSHD